MLKMMMMMMLKFTAVYMQKSNATGGLNEKFQILALIMLGSVSNWHKQKYILFVCVKLLLALNFKIFY